MTIIKPIQFAEVPTEQQVRPIPQGGVDSWDTTWDWEHEFAAKNPELYPWLRTAADIVPFAWAATPSGRRQFTEMSTGWKAATIGLDAAVFLPASWIGKGLKAVKGVVINRPISAIIKRLPFLMKDIKEASPVVMERLMQEVNRFEPLDQARGLFTKYGLTETAEIDAVTRGVRLEGETSQAFKSLYTKQGILRSPVKKDLEKWGLDPVKQKHDFFIGEWERIVKENIGNPEFKSEAVFNAQKNRLFNPEMAEKMTLANIGEEDLDLVIKDMLLNKSKVIRSLESRSWHYLLDPEKVFAKFEPAYGVLSKIFRPTALALGTRGKAILSYMTKFDAYLAANGLGEMTKEAKFIPNFTAKHWTDAGELITKLDTATSMGKATAELQALTDSYGEPVRRIAQAWQQTADDFYNEYFAMKIPQIIDRAGLNEFGKLQFNRLFSNPTDGLVHKVTAALSSSANVPYEMKYKIINETIDSLKTAFNENHSWFNEFDPALKKLSADGKKDLNRLLADISLRKGESRRGIADFLENYGPRMYEDPIVRTGKEATRFPTEMTASFEKGRTVEEPVGLVTDLTKIFSVRARGQANALYFYPELTKAASLAKEGLPPSLRNYVDHFLNRVAGRPSKADMKQADFLRGFFGGKWDARREMALSYTINDLTYMGGIGFRPFSILRNYFQAPLTVPADLGGVKDILWFTKGLWVAATDADARAFIRSTGTIAEYNPDLLFRPVVKDFGKAISILGKEVAIPSLSRIKDASLWMFKYSDYHTRYMAGGAAIAKWDYYLSKFGTVLADGSKVLEKTGLDNFKKKLNLYTREAWVRADIEKLLNVGGTEALTEAKRAWTKSVIGDTQFLYGPLHTPLVAYTGGGIGRTAMVFQSWWMNYGNLIGKWIARSDSVDLATSRMFTWMLCSAMSYQVMQEMWGKRSAASSVLFGPFPQAIDFPASWRPVADAFKVVISAGSIPLGITSIESTKARMVAMLNSGAVLVPGGIQLKKSITGTIDEGFKGFGKSLIGMRTK